MTRTFRAVLLLVVFIALACSKKEPPAKEVAAPLPEPSPENKILSPIGEFPGEMQEIRTFDRAVHKLEPTPGVLPPARGSTQLPEPGDKAWRSTRYSMLLQRDFNKIQGFWIAKQPAPIEVKTRAPGFLTTIKITVKTGNAEFIAWGPGGMPALGPEPQVGPMESSSPQSSTDALKQDQGEKTSTEAEKKDEKNQAPDKAAEKTAAIPSVKPSDPPLDPDKPIENELTTLFERTLRLRPDRNSMVWAFEPPIEINLKRGAALQVNVEILQPELDPTIATIPAYLMGFIDENFYRSQTMTREVVPIQKPEGSACWGNPNGQLICLYASGMAAFHLVSPFVNASQIGSWSQMDDVLTLKMDKTKPPLEIRLQEKLKPQDFGELGQGWVVKTTGGEELDPYADLIRAIAAENEITLSCMSEIWLTQVKKEGEPEAVVRCNDKVFVTTRNNAFSPMRVIRTIQVGASAEVKVVWVPDSVRSVIAVRPTGEKIWRVHILVDGDDAWSEFTRQDVPWKPWQRDPTEQVQYEQGKVEANPKP